MKPAIANGHVVTIHYRLTLDDGSIADDSFGGDPLVYLHGAHNIVPGLERQLTGKQVGDTCECTVPPNEGYGEYDPAADQTVPKTAFPPNTDLKVGMSFQTRARNGQPMPVWIRAVKGDDVTVTANHPLAGQSLNFKVEVKDVRRATNDEKKHGHAHGPGGHHHH
jgi:FKBP-type peptidyl-prolyl cis-trans isomerase SlyD